MKKFTRAELYAMPELRHLEVNRGGLGGYYGTMYTYRDKVALGEATISGLTQDESIAAIDQATEHRIADMEAWAEERSRERNHDVTKILVTTIIGAAAMVGILFLIYSYLSTEPSQASPLSEKVTSWGLYVMCFLIPLTLLVGAFLAARRQSRR